MPGFEVIGKEEQDALMAIFTQSNGVLFAHGFGALRNGRYRVRELEQAFSAKIGCRHTQAVTSGTMAQFVAMLALGVRPGDEVITQSFTFVATVETIVAIGAVPVVVDINDTFNMDPTALERAITSRTKLIVPVHMLGNPAEMDEILAIGKRHGIPVLEDACEATGAAYRGRSVGTLGNAGVFSLDFGKVITCGEGGLIVTNDPAIHKFNAEYHDHGHENNSRVPRGRDTRSFPGLNLRMTEMQAAVALEQLKKLDNIVAANRRNKRILKSILSQSDKITFRRLTDEAGDLADTLIFSFEASKQAEECVKKLGEAGLGTKNVPDAIDWHFAGTWGHIFKEVGTYKDTWRTAWSRSADLLYRSVALPIMVRSPEKELEKQGELILKILKSI